MDEVLFFRRRGERFVSDAWRAPKSGAVVKRARLILAHVPSGTKIEDRSYVELEDWRGMNLSPSHLFEFEVSSKYLPEQSVAHMLHLELTSEKEK